MSHRYMDENRCEQVMGWVIGVGLVVLPPLVFTVVAILMPAMSTLVLFALLVAIVGGTMGATWAFREAQGGLLTRFRDAVSMALLALGLASTLAGAQWLLSLGSGDRAHVVKLVAPGLQVVGASDVNASPKTEPTEAQAEYAEEQERRAWAACEQAVLEDERSIGWWQNEREVIRTWLTQCLESRGYAVLRPEDPSE